MESSFGIDFKQNHLILTLLKKSFGKIRVVDVGVHPVSPEAQKEERETQMVSLISSFISKHEISKERVFVSIPREKVVARFIQLPAATRENLRKVVEYETPKYTPFDKGDVYFDVQILKQNKDSLHLFAVFVRKGELDDILSLLKKVGIRPVSIQIPSTAALNLFLFHQGSREKEISVLMEVTESFLEMNVVHGKGEWRDSFHLPLNGGGSTWKNTLKQSGFNVDAFPITTFYLFGLGESESMTEAVKKAGPMKGLSAPPMHRLALSKKLPNPSAVYASLGVPLKGLVKTHVNLNLLPMEMRKKLRQVEKTLFMVLIPVALILGMAWGVGIFFQYRNEINGLTSEISLMKPEVEKIQTLQTQKEILSKEIEELHKIRAGEIPKVKMLEELTQLLPPTVWIWNMKYNGKEIEISGYADSASDLIPVIDKSPLFEKVEFLAPVTKERQMHPEGVREKERFKIKARLESRRAGP